MVLPSNISDYFTKICSKEPKILVCPTQFSSDKTAPLRKRVTERRLSFASKGSVPVSSTNCSLTLTPSTSKTAAADAY